MLDVDGIPTINIMCIVPWPLHPSSPRTPTVMLSNPSPSKSPMGATGDPK